MVFNPAFTKLNAPRSCLNGLQNAKGAPIPLGVTLASPSTKPSEKIFEPSRRLSGRGCLISFKRWWRRARRDRTFELRPMPPFIGSCSEFDLPFGNDASLRNATLLAGPASTNEARMLGRVARENFNWWPPPKQVLDGERDSRDQPKTLGRPTTPRSDCPVSQWRRRSAPARTHRRTPRLSVRPAPQTSCPHGDGFRSP
jgi:hypothetical protein